MAEGNIDNPNLVETVTGYTINTSVLPANADVKVVRTGNVVTLRITGVSPISSGSSLNAISGLPKPVYSTGYHILFPWGTNPTTNNILQYAVNNQGQLLLNIGQDKPNLYISITYVCS